MQPVEVVGTVATMWRQRVRINFRWMLGLLGLPILVGGCATHALWQEGRFAAFHEPADPPNLALYQSSADHKVLVAYDESNDRNDLIRRRFYWVNVDHDPFKNPHKPGFVSDAKHVGLPTIPIFPAPRAEPTSGPIYAVIANGQDFTLFTGAQARGPFELPVYPDASGRVKQVLLTPVAVAADATIVGDALFVWCWSGGGLAGVH